MNDRFAVHNVEDFMTAAAITFVYNEKINLPIWIGYYGAMLGKKNLFVVDRGSDDGSTDHLGDVNLIKVPKNEFDEHAKTDFMSRFHSSLLSFYETVIITDCDEIIVPDPGVYNDLGEYIERLSGDYANGMGVDIVHIITEEHPIDLDQPILSQRRHGRFHSPECKHLISRIPIKWLPGLHSSDKPPIFDPNLVVFHLKLMDYGVAMGRQKVNLETVWSEGSLRFNYGAHHRYEYAKFVRDCFLSPIDLLSRSADLGFKFDTEIQAIKDRTVVDTNGSHSIPMDISKMVLIPDRFNKSF
jgi:hypothetical protein